MSWPKKSLREFEKGLRDHKHLALHDPYYFAVYHLGLEYYACQHRWVRNLDCKRLFHAAPRDHGGVGCFGVARRRKNINSVMKAGMLKYQRSAVMPAWRMPRVKTAPRLATGRQMPRPLDIRRTTAKPRALLQGVGGIG